MSAANSVRLPRIAKGRRPAFYEDPAIDQLFAIVTALTGEISVLFDRLDSIERLLTTARVLPVHAVESYVPDGSAAAVGGGRPAPIERRVFAVLELYGARQAPPASRPGASPTRRAARAS
jgi:hypothetical protein